MHPRRDHAAAGTAVLGWRLDPHDRVPVVPGHLEHAVSAEPQQAPDIVIHGRWFSQLLQLSWGEPTGLSWPGTTQHVREPRGA